MEFLNGINALTLVFTSLLIFAIAYRFYGIYLANKVLRLNDKNTTPAVEFADGKDYVATNKNVLFGHHFAAIAAAGPLVGPVLAAQFGYLPGAIWILIGCVLGGGVHDMVVLFASVRHKGQSLATIASKEIGKTTGTVAGFAILFILILTLAGLSLACINAMHEASWSLFTVVITMPIAIIMGLIMRYRKNSVTFASILGGVLLIAGIIGGHNLMQNETMNNMFTWDITTISIAIPLYGFLASVLPVWLLLVPRDYLSTYLKIGTIIMLAIGVIVIHPTIQMPALTEFINGGGPVIGGPVLPFIFIVIACGAISGFHAVIATGTTPKMLNREKEILFVGYGAMLVEGFVALMALIAACTLMPGDYFAINTPKETYDAFLATHPSLHGVEIDYFSERIGIDLHGRTGGAVSLAVGMAHIFNKIPYMDQLMAYWYNFAIMFEAVFILTAIDAGTRVGRFFLQEMLGSVIPKFNDKNWTPGIIISSLLFTFAWGYLVFTGNVSSIWPLFGISNQLLAACGLIVCTTMLIRLNRGKYALCSAIPGVFMAIITFWAGYIQVMDIYIPKQQYLLATLAVVAMVLMLVVFVGAFRKWYQLLKVKTSHTDFYGETVKELVER
ncbi:MULTISPECIES: carbon starvation protein A [Chryseobacterium]|jgi:carbon starvation protein|uniref:carbon starvation CstA family protein n=1 Tax=Chryseobacterium TaxID=59732 RepID=UPI0012F045A3|nr:MULTISPECIES: carbon starvation protein A [Chryseobacterium]MBM7418979.1 carbon starvation protein [Chryseobacterium sp. JUb44]MBO6183928.1 carbon starvation protein A [Chryseobacterium sp.]MBW3522683.1 carbon starvation protein A [Chryseobacterium sp. NKUCC03_KSP]MDH6208897.1 carbon starvation protein [Chryseobacterium sp. BIGb0186]WSO11759.1 carbon starvation protein A [Chryseobacterium scophthalmum]